MTGSLWLDRWLDIVHLVAYYAVVVVVIDSYRSPRMNVCDDVDNDDNNSDNRHRYWYWVKIVSAVSPVYHEWPVTCSCRIPREILLQSLLLPSSAALVVGKEDDDDDDSDQRPPADVQERVECAPTVDPCPVESHTDYYYDDRVVVVWSVGC